MEEEKITENEKEQYKQYTWIQKNYRGSRGYRRYLSAKAEQLRKLELLEKMENGKYRLTKRGMFIANYV